MASNREDILRDFVSSVIAKCRESDDRRVAKFAARDFRFDFDVDEEQTGSEAFVTDTFDLLYEKNSLRECDFLKKTLLIFRVLIWKNLVKGDRNVERAVVAKSDDFSIDVWIVKQGFTLKQHYVKDQSLILTLLAGPDSKMGHSMAILKSAPVYSAKKLSSYEPNLIVADPEVPTFLVRFYRGDKCDDNNVINFADLKLGREYLLIDKEGDGRDEDEQQVAEYYNHFVGIYRGAIRGIGYYMPEYLAEMLVEDYDLGGHPTAASKILDLACGDGLFGEMVCAMKSGKCELNGFDISRAMLSRAADLKLYRELHQGDLLQPLPFKDAYFDFVVCLGATGAFLKPTCLRDWIRVTKPGGIIAYNIDTIHNGPWEEEQKRLEEEEKSWVCRFASDPAIPLCPSILNDDDSLFCMMGKVFVFQRTA